MTGHGKAERADRGTLQQAGAEAPGVVGAGLRLGSGGQAGCTPLHVAAHSGSEEVVRALLGCKADVEARSKVLSGRGCGLRLRVREAGGEMECQGAVFRGGGVRDVQGRESGLG